MAEGSGLKGAGRGVERLASKAGGSVRVGLWFFGTQNGIY